MSRNAQYARLVARLRAERGNRCELCGSSPGHPHHICAVGITGIASDLVIEPANILLLCNDCHALMHPQKRSYPWLTLAKGRAPAQVRLT